MARRTAFASLSGLAATRASVSGFAGFDREVIVSDYLPAASCPPVGGQPTCRSVEVRVYYKGQMGEITTTVITVIAQ